MKEHRDLIQVEGDFYRILSPFEGNDTAWMVVSRDKKQAVAGYYERLNKVNASWMRLRFKGLDEDQLYKVKWEDKCLKAYGNELMYAGIPVDRDYCNKTNGDFHSVNDGIKIICRKNIRLTRKITGRRIWRPVIGWRSSSQAET